MDGNNMLQNVGREIGRMKVLDKVYSIYDNTGGQQSTGSIAVVIMANESRATMPQRGKKATSWIERMGIVKLPFWIQIFKKKDMRGRKAWKD